MLYQSVSAYESVKEGDLCAQGTHQPRMSAPNAVVFGPCFSVSMIRPGWGCAFCIVQQRRQGLFLE